MCNDNIFKGQRALKTTTMKQLVQLLHCYCTVNKDWFKSSIWRMGCMQKGQTLLLVSKTEYFEMQAKAMKRLQLRYKVYILGGRLGIS